MVAGSHQARACIGEIISGIAETARIGAISPASGDDPAEGNPVTHLVSLYWTLRAKRACVLVTDPELDRLAPVSPRQRLWASAGFGW